MSPFAKAFAATLVVQTAILILLAVLFFSGGPQANAARFSIALFGMVVIAFFGQLGVSSLGGIVAGVVMIMVVIALLVAAIKASLFDR
jgi:hypothetical protein